MSDHLTDDLRRLRATAPDGLLPGVLTAAGLAERVGIEDLVDDAVGRLPDHAHERGDATASRQKDQLVAVDERVENSRFQAKAAPLPAARQGAGSRRPGRLQHRIMPGIPERFGLRPAPPALSRLAGHRDHLRIVALRGHADQQC